MLFFLHRPLCVLHVLFYEFHVSAYMCLMNSLSVRFVDVLVMCFHVGKADAGKSALGKSMFAKPIRVQAQSQLNDPNEPQQELFAQNIAVLET